MAVEIVMPRVDMDMASGQMGRWHAAEGQHVVKGATLFEIETDKAAMEVEAPASGVLKFVAASEGDVLPVGACIGWIVAEGESFVPPKAKGDVGEAPTAKFPPIAVGEARGAGFAEAALDERPRATPAARRIARERGLPLAGVRGSGPLGRIQRRDVEAREAAAASGSSASNVHRLWLQPGEGPPIVFLHGFGADLNGWRPVHRLLPETYPALAIDLPGHGGSPLGEDASFMGLVEAARLALIEEGIGAAHLVGHSLGGAVAAALSHEPSVKALSLMLIAPAGLGEDINAAFFDGFLQADTEAGLTPWLNMLASDPAALGSALAKTTLRQRRERPLVAEQQRLMQAVLAGARQAIDVRGFLAAPQTPTKIVVGTEDRIIPPRYAEGLSGLIALHRFAHVGHMPHLEARREVAKLIEELARAGARA
jgi:pimeloyl-ACP methyl ester carboxylesterase